MKLLHITAQKPFKTGSGIYVKNTIKEFDKKGYKQAIIAGISRNESIDIDTELFLDKYPVHFDTRDIPFPVVGMSDVMPYKSTRYRDLDSDMLDCITKAFTKQIMLSIEEFNPDIIICHHLYYLTALTRSLVKNKRILGICHGTDLRQMQSINLKNNFIKENVRELDAILALHNEQKKLIEESFHINQNNIYVMGSGYDDSIFYNSPSCHKEDYVKIIYAGKISFSKGLVPLIKAYSSLSIPRDKIKLSLAGMGNGNEYEEILHLAKNSTNKIEFLGNLSQENLAKEFRKSHIFILPSFYEGLPLVLIEALASGLHTITSEIPGIREWLEEGVNESGKIRYLPLPRLKEVDIPFEEDLSIFEKSIKKEILKVIKDIKEERATSSIDLSHLSWRGLVSKIESIL